MQVGDLVTGGDVVGVVKENGPFGMKGSSAAIPASHVAPFDFLVFVYRPVKSILYCLLCCKPGKSGFPTNHGARGL